MKLKAFVVNPQWSSGSGIPNLVSHNNLWVSQWNYTFLLTLSKSLSWNDFEVFQEWLYLESEGYNFPQSHGKSPTRDSDRRKLLYPKKYPKASSHAHKTSWETLWNSFSPGGSKGYLYAGKSRAGRGRVFAAIPVRGAPCSIIRSGGEFGARSPRLQPRRP